MNDFEDYDLDDFAALNSGANLQLDHQNSPVTLFPNVDKLLWEYHS